MFSCVIDDGIFEDQWGQYGRCGMWNTIALNFTVSTLTVYYHNNWCSKVNYTVLNMDQSKNIFSRNVGIQDKRQKQGLFIPKLEHIFQNKTINLSLP